MNQSAITPQQMVVAAPLDLMLSMISEADYSPIPGSSLAVRRLDSSDGRILLEFTTRDTRTHDQVVKQLIIDPPDHAVYRHVAGPYTGTVEEIQLAASEGGTTVTLTALYERLDGTNRLVRHVLEEGAREHLGNLKNTIERRARRLGVTGRAGVLVSVPRMTTEEEVLAASAEQERMEWGHSGHGRGVARMATALAQKMQLPDRHVEDLRRAALLHDLGKVAIDSELWGRLGTLSPEQRAQMEAHARLGYHLGQRAHLNEPVLTSILHHHERWDGAGYPDHVAGNEIPLKARILGLAEYVDAMMRASYRRDLLPTREIIATVQRGSGTQWDPLLAHHMMRMLSGR
ncbi:MAG TPA: HD domain-containing phosphohydrolase [Chloroflexota bacterium]|nr:HD domain-containing phosphohydrolase [Chloroflexota bacterium]